MVFRVRTTLLMGIAACCLVLVAAKFELELQRVEQVYGEGLFDFRNLRVRKYNRTTYALNGTLVLAEDLDDNYTVVVKAAHSRLGNNQFNEYPMKLAEQPCCQWYNDHYRSYQSILPREQTNLPLIPAEGMCPFPKGNYWFKDGVFPDAESFFPPMLPEGYWRVTYNINGPQMNNCSMNLFVRLKRVMELGYNS